MVKIVSFKTATIFAIILATLLLGPGRSHCDSGWVETNEEKVYFCENTNDYKVCSGLTPTGKGCYRITKLEVVDLDNFPYVNIDGSAIMAKDGIKITFTPEHIQCEGYYPVDGKRMQKCKYTVEVENTNSESVAIADLDSFKKEIYEKEGMIKEKEKIVLDSKKEEIDIIQKESSYRYSSSFFVPLNSGGVFNYSVMINGEKYIVPYPTWSTDSQADWDLGTYNHTESTVGGDLTLVATQDENITDHLVISEIQIDSIDGTGGTNDDWIELYNPTGSAIDLNASSYRIERISSGGGDPAILMRIGDATDGTYPGGVTISAYGFYLIVRDDAAQSFLDMADAIGTDADFTLTDSNTIYLGTGPISGPGDADIVDWVGYGAATDCNGTCAPQPPDGGSIERKAQSDSTAVDLASGGDHENYGNAIDVDNNTLEFVSQANDNPQNHTETETFPVTYDTAGDYISKVFDAEGNSTWDNIYWSATINNTIQNLTFQARSCDDDACAGETFVGPDGTSSTYHNESGDALNTSELQWFQYKAFLTTSDTSETIQLHEVNVSYTPKVIDDDWNTAYECDIDEARNFSDRTITANCDVNILSGGSLNLTNVTFDMNGSSNYDYEFVVHAGGKVNFYDVLMNTTGYLSHFDVGGNTTLNSTNFTSDFYLRFTNNSANTLKEVTASYYMRIDENSTNTLINVTTTAYYIAFSDFAVTDISGSGTSINIARFYEDTINTMVGGYLGQIDLYADTDCTVFIDDFGPGDSVTNVINSTGCDYLVNLTGVNITETAFAGEANGIAYINNSNFTNSCSGRATSQTHVENTVFSGTWITLETAKLYAKNSNFTGTYTSFRGTSDSNFTTPYSRITNIEVDGEGSLGEHVPIIRGYIDLTTLYDWTNNAQCNRYFPIYTQTVGGNPDPTKNVTIKKDSVYITSGITNANGYVNLNVTFNETNYNQNYSFYVEDVFRSNFTFMNDTSPNGIILRESIIIYNITDCVELQGMENNLSGNYTLMNNINCSDTINWNEGAGFEPIGDSTNKFEGNLDGKNYNITDLFMVRGTNTGLFGYISNNGIISNVHLKDINITGGSGTSGIAGYVKPGKIENCSVTGFLNGTENVGGMVGNNDGSIILNSWTDIDVYSTGNYAGGIFGVVYAGGITINNTYAMGDVTGGSNYVGGLGGDDGTGSVSNSYAIGKVTTSGTYVGGLLGRNGGTVKNCFATGNVSGSSAGGLIGVHSGTIINSYYNNHAGTPNYCVGNGVQTGCTAIQDNEDYFKDDVYPCYGPMSSWDFFSTWEERDNDYPSLTWEDLGGDIPLINNDWVVDWIANCVLNDDTDLGTGRFILNGTCPGSFTLNTTLAVKNREFIPDGTSCQFIRLPAGKFIRTG